MRSNVSDVRRAATACAVLVAAALTASCGGGQAASTFTASRVIAFGDETSVIDDSLSPGNGRKYSVNGLAPTDAGTIGTAIDCTFNPIWIQTVASHYGLVFPQCLGASPVGAPNSRIRAFYGAVAADLALQIDVQQNENGMRTGDLATVLVGENDIIQQYMLYPTVGEPQLLTNLEAAGAEVGQQVNRIVTFDTRVLISTTANVGYTPFALNEKAIHVDTDRQQLLIRLTSAFNSAVRSNITNDGRHIGLVTFDELIQTVGKFTPINGFTNSTQAACDFSSLALPTILTCTDLTLIPGATPLTYLWADERHVTYGGQLSLGNMAVNRLMTNPF